MNRRHELLVIVKYFNSQINNNAENMSELGLSEVLTIAQTIGIVGTMILTLYFSKRQIQSLSL
ncbi:MAG: hypothetical protein WAZ77_17905, partial [Candidatus Nitrosopolaris sp.]